MNYTNTGQLPFRADGLQWPYLNLTLNNPPITMNFPHLPEIQAATPLIIAATAIEIQNCATMNPLRMFMYNMYSENMFANQSFQQLVMGICDYVAVYGFMKRQYQNMDQAITDAVPKLVRTMAAVLVRNIPPLQNIVDPQAGQDIQQIIGFYDNLVMEIDAAKRSGFGQQSAAMAGMAPGMAWGGNSNVQQQSWQTYGGGGMAPGFGGGQAGWGGQGGQSGGYSARFGQQPAGPTRSSVFGNDGRGQPSYGGNTVGRTNVSARYGNAASYAPASPSPAQVSTQLFVAAAAPQQQEAAVQVQPTPAPPPPVVEETQEIPAVNNWHIWRPSAEQPYLPVFDPSTHELFFVKHANGTINYNLKQRNIPVDPTRHSTNSTIGNPPANQQIVPPGQVLPRIAEGVAELSGTAVHSDTDSDKPAVDVPAVYEYKGPLYSISESAAVFQGSIERLALNNGVAPEVFRTYAMVADPVVTASDENDIVRKYASARTFSELREMLEGDLNIISPALWALCNRKMTQTVNRVLRQNMSIASLRIESFVADIGDLPAYLTKKFGDSFSDAFLRFQRPLIASTFELMYEEEQKGWNQQYIDIAAFEGGPIPFIAYPSSMISLTYIDHLLPELGIEMAPHIASQVLEANTPVIYTLLKQLFAELNEKGEMMGSNLIVLNDGHLLEATEGFLMPDSYLLTLVK